MKMRYYLRPYYYAYYAKSKYVLCIGPSACRGFSEP